MRHKTALSLLIFAFALTACGGSKAPLPISANAEAGRVLFHEDAFPTCGSCHWKTSGIARIGPSLLTIGAEASSRVPGQSAEIYLRESIVTPNAHVALGFAANIMATAYKAQLSDQEIADLVAYLLTLK